MKFTLWNGHKIYCVCHSTDGVRHSEYRIAPWYAFVLYCIDCFKWKNC